MKSCRICKLQLSLDEFSRDRSRPDGRQACCKACDSRRIREYFRKHPDRVYLSVKKWRAKNPEKFSASRDRWRRNNREKAAAHQKVHHAIVTGRLRRQCCEVCGSRAEAHHEDYSRPLDVRWVCKFHHKQLHKDAMLSVREKGAAS